MPAMLNEILSAAQARQLVRSNPRAYVVEVDRWEAHLFTEAGFVELQSPRGPDSVSFINRRREASANAGARI